MLKLDENYRLEFDENNVTLIYENKGEINPKTNKPTISSNKWYCRDIVRALVLYRNQVLNYSESIDELFKRLDEVEQTIINVIKK